MGQRNFIVRLDREVIDEIIILYDLVPSHLLKEAPIVIKEIYNDLILFLVARVVEWSLMYDSITWLTNAGYEGIYDYIDSGFCEFDPETADDLLYHITNTLYEEQTHFYKLITDNIDFEYLNEDTTVYIVADALTQVIYQLIPPIGATESLFEALKNNISEEIKKQFSGAMAEVDLYNRCVVLLIDEDDLISNYDEDDLDSDT